MKNYAILRMEKIKGVKKMHDAYAHNERLYAVKNADPTKTELNDTLVQKSLGDYNQMCEEYLAQLKGEGVPSYTIRKDAVKGIDIILTTSEALDPSLYDAWKEKNIEWLNKEFNPPDGKAIITLEDGSSIEVKTDNVRYAVMHNDEQTPHIHAFIVPIDEKGHLNARSYTGGSKAMKDHQTSYAEAMEEFGLSRGVKGTISSHNEVKTFYAMQNSILRAELPEPQKEESVLDYKARADEIYRQLLAINYKQNENIKQERNEMQAEKKQINSLLKEGEPEELLERVKEHKAFEKGVENYPEKEEAQEAEKQYRHIIDWELLQEKKKKKEDLYI